MTYCFTQISHYLRCPRSYRHRYLDGWRCQYCGSRKGVQVHHISPRSQLGNDAEYNLITLCSR